MILCYSVLRSPYYGQNLQIFHRTIPVLHTELEFRCEGMYCRKLGTVLRIEHQTSSIKHQENPILRLVLHELIPVRVCALHAVRSTAEVSRRCHDPAPPSPWLPYCTVHSTYILSQRLITYTMFFRTVQFTVSPPAQNYHKWTRASARPGFCARVVKYGVRIVEFEKFLDLLP